MYFKDVHFTFGQACACALHVHSMRPLCFSVPAALENTAMRSCTLLVLLERYEESR
jgi:hypothetical protein